MGSSTSFSAAWTTLSATAGIAAFSLPRPPASGISRCAPATAGTCPPSAEPAGRPGTPWTPMCSYQPDGHAVHAGRVRRPGCPHPAERHIQRRRVVHELTGHQTGGPDRPPPNGLGLHPRYPRPRPVRGGVWALPFGGASCGIPSLLPSSKPLPPSPCAGLSPGSRHYGGSAPPGPFSGRCAYPAAGRMPAAGNRDRAVPVFTVVRSAEEEPGCVPSGLATGTGPDFPDGLPARGNQHGARELPPHRDRRTRRARQIRQVRAGGVCLRT